MKNIKVLGTGCAKCKATVELLKQASQQLGIPIELTKIEDIQQIMAYGVMGTPAVVIDEHVVHAGGLPSKAQIQEWLK
jgi:small redox-active disulfide protein 2